MKRGRLKYLLFLVVIGVLTVYNYYGKEWKKLTVSPLIQSEYLTAVFPEEQEFLPHGKGEIVRHTYFVLSYNSIHKQANWVYYFPQLTNKTNKTKRTNNFKEDTSVWAGSAKPSDYTKSGYDRGHLCPAGDMTLSVEAMSETFFMSNMSPQVPGFNRGIWKSVEDQVRVWGKRERIYVVTGPVFKNLKGKIGKSGISVPGYYYKVIYAPLRQQMIGFILPNEKSRKSFMEYVVTVDSVENFTGIDFFPQLPDSLENRLESTVDDRKW